MSLYDYRVSQDIRSNGFPFYALIMAAMAQADTENAAKLQFLFPDVWEEVKERYNAPGGMLESER